MASIILRKPSNKRINPDKLFEYDNFGIPDFAMKTLSGAFRDNIRFFLQSFAEIQDCTVNEMSVWCTSLFSENDGVFPLYTLEETVQDSVDPFCEYCELAEWGHHFVCKRKYYLVIPSKENWNAPLDEFFLEFESHILYGLIHCNGYGHLIGINGLKNNSKFLRADDSMKFWDRLCTVLKARSISAHYLSRTDSIELSLIHGVAHHRPWLAKWGYKFSERNHGITEQKYRAAIRLLSRFSIGMIIDGVRDKIKSKRIRGMIENYKKLSAKPLTTLGDLLGFMLDCESRIPRDVYNGCKFESKTEGSVIGYEILVNSMMENCRWPHRRLENVLFVIVDLLKQHKANTGGNEGRMSRQELRDGARKSIGDTGLIDFVIKSIKCFQVDNQIIRRSINPFSRIAEFTIHDTTSQGGSSSNLSRDVWFLYETVLARYPQTRTILNCSIFLVKEWPINGNIANQSMELVCKVLPTFDELDSELTRRLSPGEVVVVEPRATIGDLRRMAQCALRDTYCIMDEFEVSQIGGLKKIDDEELVSSVVEGGDQVWVRGSGFDFSTFLRYEDGGKKSITSQSNGIS